MKRLMKMLEGMETDLGVVGDIIGVVCLLGSGYAFMLLAYGWGF